MGAGFNKNREAVRDRKHSGCPSLITERLKDVSAISLQMIFIAFFFCKNLKSFSVDNASQETMI